MCTYHSYVLKDLILGIIFLSELMLSGDSEISKPWGWEAGSVCLGQSLPVPGSPVTTSEPSPDPKSSRSRGAHPVLLSPPAEDLAEAQHVPALRYLRNSHSSSPKRTVWPFHHQQSDAARNLLLEGQAELEGE